MNLLPTSLGLRPRLALELRPEGVVAARSDDAAALVSAVSSNAWPAGTLAPGLKPGNVTRRGEAVAGVRKVLEAVALKEREATVVVPDAAVRVLLLDFDALPPKPADALPIVRFRLKKLLPFDSEDAVVSYQVMSQIRGSVRVLAVAIPRGVLAEYEALVREAGFVPGAVLPSTLAVCAGFDEAAAATLLVNAGEGVVTTAIVQGGVLLLHRTVDLAAEGLDEKIANVRAAEDMAPEVPPELLATGVAAGLSEGEFVAVDRERQVAGTGVPVMGGAAAPEMESRTEIQARLRERTMAEEARRRATSEQSLRDGSAFPPRQVATAREVTQAVSVAAAYFEDTLERAPGVVMASGTLGAETLGGMLRTAGFGPNGLRVVETVDPGMLTGGATTTRVAPGWLAGVRGALMS